MIGALLAQFFVIYLINFVGLGVEQIHAVHSVVHCALSIWLHRSHFVASHVRQCESHHRNLGALIHRTRDENGNCNVLICLSDKMIYDYGL